MTGTPAALAGVVPAPRTPGVRIEHALVTGAAGFIGSHVAAELLRLGARVTGIDRRSPASDPIAQANLAGLAHCDRFHLVAADLRRAGLASLLGEAQVVFHLAARAGVRRSWGERFADYVVCNVLATQRLPEACAAAEVPRVVTASSSSVYGHASGRASMEGDLPAPVSPYGVTKLAAERLCLAYANQAQGSTSVVALRYFTIYGPRQRPDMLISRIMRAAITGHPVTLHGSGAQRRDFTFISDIVAATLAAARVDARAAVVNVGSGVSVTVAEVIEMVAAITGAPVPVVRRMDQPGDVDATTADLSVARELLGYEPRICLAEGLRRQWEWPLSQHRTTHRTRADMVEVP